MLIRFTFTLPFCSVARRAQSDASMRQHGQPLRNCRNGRLAWLLRPKLFIIAPCSTSGFHPHAVTMVLFMFSLASPQQNETVCLLEEPLIRWQQALLLLVKPANYFVFLKKCDLDHSPNSRPELYHMRGKPRSHRLWITPQQPDGLWTNPFCVFLSFKYFLPLAQNKNVPDYLRSHLVHIWWSGSVHYNGISLDHHWYVYDLIKVDIAFSSSDKQHLSMVSNANFLTIGSSRLQNDAVNFFIYNPQEHPLSLEC